MKKTKLLVAMLLLSFMGGCQLIYTPLDKVFSTIVDQVLEYCNIPYTDRLGGYIIINGRLLAVTSDADTAPHVTIYCPGDPEIEEG